MIRLAIRRSAESESTNVVPIGRRERNKLEKRARIVEAARRLFETQGYAQTTTQQIAEAADIGTGTLFLYAQSKEDLLNMIFKDEIRETAEEGIRTLPRRRKVCDQFMHFFDCMIRYHERDIELTKILLKSQIVPADRQLQRDLTELVHLVLRDMAGIVETARDAGRLPADIDPEIAAEVIFSSYYLGLLRWLGGQISREVFLDHLRRQIILVVG